MDNMPILSSNEKETSSQTDNCPREIIKILNSSIKGTFII